MGSPLHILFMRTKAKWVKGRKEQEMRYYRYGTDNTKREVKAEEKRQNNAMERFGELIIDEDTVYEIDEECLRCQKEE